MTRSDAIDLANAHGLKTYPHDTAATILARLNAHLAVQSGAIAERAAARVRFAPFTVRQHYQPRAMQLRLALVLPRDFSGIRGIAAN